MEEFESREVGVGPWQGPLPTAEHFDPELLAAGDRRNVADEFRYWRLEAIVEELERRRHPLQIAIENLEHDFNIGSVVRTANAFNVSAVHIVGRKRWNRRGAMVTDRYLSVHHHESAQELAKWAQEHELTIVALENVEGSVPIETFDLPHDCLLLVGQEGGGLSAEAIEVAEAVVEITQFGSTRSLNAGAAAAIAMHAWVRRHVFGQKV